jgi:hypothetical protein
MKLPARVFCTGSAGSRWSYIIQQLEGLAGANTTDRDPVRREWHNTHLESIDSQRNPDKISFTGHKGAYFGRGMEYEAKLSASYLDQAWADPAAGCKFVKSHEWSYVLPDIRCIFPADWLLLIYRPDMDSYAWWHQVGGFSIDYPKYSAIGDHAGILCEIIQQNKKMLEFSTKHDCRWAHFTNRWIEENFGQELPPVETPVGVLVSLVKP